MGKKNAKRSRVANQPPPRDDLVFYCSACQGQTLVREPPSAVTFKVVCPLCGADVPFRGQPSGRLTLPRRGGG